MFIVDATLPLGRRYLKQSPVTSVIGFTLFVIWFLLWNHKVDVSSVASSFASVVKQGEVWRLISSSFSHLSILHLAMNVSSLFSLSSLELNWGSVQYLRFAFFSASTKRFSLSRRLHAAASSPPGLVSHPLRSSEVCSPHNLSRSVETVWTLGYSCVLFALMTATILQRRDRCPVNFFGICFATRLLPVPFLSFS